MSLSLCLPHCVSLSVSISLCLPHCVSHCDPLTVSPSLCLSLCLPLCLSLSLPHCVSLTVSLTVPPSLCLPLCVSHCVSLTVSLSLCLPHCVSPQVVADAALAASEARVAVLKAGALALVPRLPRRWVAPADALTAAQRKQLDTALACGVSHAALVTLLRVRE